MKTKKKSPLKKKRAILLGSEIRDKKKWASVLSQLKILSSDLLVGVDRGAWHWKELGFQPDLAIGDWDSLPIHARARKMLRETAHHTLAVQKDRSDLYFALDHMRQKKIKEIYCLGVTGGRPDHHLAMIQDLAHFSEHFASLNVYSPEATYYFLSSRNRRLKASQLPFRRTVSLFALSPRVQGVNLRGFEYPLYKATLRPSSHGLSNQVVASQGGRIEISQGRLLVIVLCPIMGSRAL